MKKKHTTKESSRGRERKKMELNSGCSDKFVTDVLQAIDEEDALLRMLEQSQRAYSNGDYQTVKEAFSDIRENVKDKLTAEGILEAVRPDQDISDELSLQSALDE